MRLTKGQKDEIDALRRESRQTSRPTVRALEEILYEPLPVRIHGQRPRTIVRVSRVFLRS